jgi:pimeloyl-ACP methyl ester carboxylesterase
MGPHTFDQSESSLAGSLPATQLAASRILLKDGRLLAWSQYGATQGFPLFYLHEAGSSRLEAAFFDAEARRSGFRLIAVDRPGLGESDPHALMTRASCADDLLQLADQRGVSEFGILSSGAGSAIALVSAAHSPERVKCVLGVSSQLALCNARERVVCRFLRGILSTFLRCMLGLRLAFGNSTPEQYLRRLCDSLTYADRRLLDNPDIRMKLVQSASEAVRHGVSGVARDTALSLAPLNVSAASLPMPVHVWLGGVEHPAQFSSVPSFLASLPRGVLHRLGNHGRYFFWRYSEGVFTTATRILKEQGPSDNCPPTKSVRQEPEMLCRAAALAG